MAPSSATPRSPKPKKSETAMPSATARRGAGNLGARRLSTYSPAKTASPTASVKPCVRSNLERKSPTWRKNPARFAGKPNSCPNCPLIMLIAIPFRYPVSMGRARKLVRKPSRARPAATQIKPTITASAIVSEICRAGSPPASGIAIAATMVQVDASGAMISCLDVQKTA